MMTVTLLIGTGKDFNSCRIYFRTMKYTIILEKEEEGGYSAQCLELPGAISQGETKEEALRNIKEAIELVLEVIDEEAKALGNHAEISAVEVSA